MNEEENYNCIDCGWYGLYEELILTETLDEEKKPSFDLTGTMCPKCNSTLIFSDEDWEQS